MTIDFACETCGARVVAERHAGSRHLFCSKRCYGAWQRTQGDHFGETTEYRIWTNMKTRCTNPKATQYRWYGACGIRVCQRWSDSFKNFLADVGLRPGPEYTLDRIVSSGHYEPGNVRWATKREQAANRKSNTVIEHNGERRILADWLRFYGQKPTVNSYDFRRFLAGQTRKQIREAKLNSGDAA